ncbi:MAG: HAD family phosphatase [Candidatus Eremiobacteraeota bacterium]|nr:HAD family phosphatase [Candidatus Eremiobacteraeota bacterium]
MSKFDLVVLDLDGTLLDPDREAPVRPAVKAAVAEALQRGVGITFATGRTWNYARQRIAELGLSLPMVSSHGATLVAADGTVLSEQRLDDGLSRQLAARAHDLPEVFCFYYRNLATGQLLIRQNRALEAMDVYHHLLGPETEVVDDLGAFLDDHQVLKFVVFDEHAEAPQRWGRWAGPLAHVSRTHHLLVEGTAPGIDKGVGVRRLIDHLQLDPARVLAVGDNFNDLPMFAAVGTSVAMGQSPDPVKKAATWIAPTFADDGVAAALRHFVLGEGER